MFRWVYTLAADVRRRGPSRTCSCGVDNNRCSRHRAFHRATQIRRASRITIILSINLKIKTQSSRRHQSSLFHLFCSPSGLLPTEQYSVSLIFTYVFPRSVFSGENSARVLCLWIQTEYYQLLTVPILKMLFSGLSQ